MYKPKIECVLLIDDDEPTNTLHTIILEENNFAREIRSVQSGADALAYLENSGLASEHQNPHPNLIFLDINMPVMNGFEFMEAYEKLPKKHQADAIVLMLTTSINTRDYEAALANSRVNGFWNKPLTEEILNEIYSSYFLAK